MHGTDPTISPDMMRSSYTMLEVNLAVSLAITYPGMFAKIYSLGEFIQNLDFFSMALII